MTVGLKSLFCRHCRYLGIRYIASADYMNTCSVIGCGNKGCSYYESRAFIPKTVAHTAPASLIDVRFSQDWVVDFSDSQGRVIKNCPYDLFVEHLPEFELAVAERRAFAQNEMVEKLNFGHAPSRHY